ncbi:MAG TPA: Fic family protein [Ruminococcus flavefaciens]|nr:Fic family protein [Ruminococcus flavefaciens]
MAKIVETVTKLEYGTGFKRDIRLHRKNRMRTIHSSLAIEGNSLTLGEVTAVIEGKVVAGKQTEIKEVKNAYEAYDKIMTLDPYDVKDFLKAHKLMTEGLVDEAGKFRSGDVGVFDGDVAVHIGARPQFVSDLIKDLFDWAKDSGLHPVLKSAILHYEIETIHPFADGNGRMGRLWQTLLLAKWNSIFAWIPMESVMNQNRPEYYDALYYGQHSGDSSRFIEFTLLALLEVLQKTNTDLLTAEQDNAQVTDQVDRAEKIIEFCVQPKSREEIQSFVGIAHREHFRAKILKPLLDSGRLKMTIPDKPNSRNQKYVKA